MLKLRLNTSLFVAVSLVSILLIVPAARSSVIVYTETMATLSGQGFGSSSPVLSLRTTGSGTQEWGGIGWNGVQDVYLLGGLAVEGAPHSQTQTVADLLAMGITKDTFGIVLNINEEGGEEMINISTFSLDFYLADGTLAFNAVYTAPQGGLQVGADGQGQGKAGPLFHVFFTGTDFESFFAGGDNRVGLSVPQGSPITGVSDGADNFVLGASGVLPEPATLSLLAIGGVIALLRRRR